MDSQKTQNIVWSLVGIGVLVWIGWSIFKPDSERTHSSNNNSNTNASVSETVLNRLQKQYSAATGWFDKKSYSVQFQNDLMSGPKTIVFMAVIDDVYKKGSDSHLRVSIPSYESGLSGSESVYIDLVCNSQPVLEKILAKNVDDYHLIPNWALVANISTFRKTALKIEAINDDDSGDSYLDLESPDAFMGSGTCVDAEYVSN